MWVVDMLMRIVFACQSLIGIALGWSQSSVLDCFLIHAGEPGLCKGPGQGWRAHR